MPGVPKRMPDIRPDFLHPPADPDVAAVVEQLTASLDDFPAVLGHFDDSLKQGATLGELRGVTESEYAALYRMARQLCDDGQFHHALPLALSLLIHSPKDGRFAFLCATCLQRLGHDDSAALLFACTLELLPQEAAAAFRLAECFERLGKNPEAKASYQLAVELARGKFECRELQDLASSRAAALAC